MSTDDVAVGAVVRYPRTGTTGKVLRVEEIDGRQYAELDSTGLYYRVDELVGADRTTGQVERERSAPWRNTSKSIRNSKSSWKKCGRKGPTRAVKAADEPSSATFFIGS